jgi:hypothetical protein
MKSDQFAFWLQGWFELEAPSRANAHRTSLIRAHLSMVFAHERRPSEFCQWLRELFQHDNPPTLEEETLGAIRQQLSREFIHVIDPSYPAEQQPMLNAIHASGKPPVKMGKDGVTPDSGLHWDPNSYNYVPGARC